MFTEDRFETLQLILAALRGARNSCRKQLALAPDEIRERQLQELKCRIDAKLRRRTKEFHKLSDVLAGR
jgi:hypothetical protein